MTITLIKHFAAIQHHFTDNV